MHKYLLTLTCQIETPGVLLGLVVAYPCGFLIQVIFFHFWTLWVLSGLWFFKSAWWCFYKEDFPLLPLWFFRYHSSTSSPSGFYSACGFQKVTGEVFRSTHAVLQPGSAYTSISNDRTSTPFELGQNWIILAIQQNLLSSRFGIIVIFSLPLK